MTYSHVAALLFKAILSNDESPYIKLFDPNRIKPVSGFTNFISQNVQVVKNFVGKIMPGPSVENFNEIGTGEGKIITYEHEKIAAYKMKTEIFMQSSRYAPIWGAKLPGIMLKNHGIAPAMDALFLRVGSTNGACNKTFGKD